MADVREPGAGGDLDGPSLDHRLTDLGDTPTAAADEVMVVTIGPSDVGGLAVVMHQDVDRA
nr:hypothetical protein [Actinotalea subterranea]